MKFFLSVILFCFIGFTSIQAEPLGMIDSPTGQFMETGNNTNQVTLVFYRLNGNENDVATIKVGNNVVGSLLPNHYTTTKACRKELSIGIAERGDITNSVHYDQMSLANMAGTIYLRVDEPNSSHRFTLTTVNPIFAKRAISSLDQQSNIINRHIPSCEIVKVAQEIPRVLKSISICTHSLFDFDVSTLKKDAIYGLNTAIEEIKQYGSAVESINVKGYTDRLGSEAHNLALSQKRADSVAKYLGANTSIKDIKSVGLGSANPVSRGCEKLLNKSELKACLRQDRRVVIEIMTRQIEQTNIEMPKELL